MPQMQPNVGRYRIIKPLGKGAMGLVYLAEDPSLNRQVAIKMLDIEADSEKDREFLRTRLLRDARAAAVLSHPNIVGVYDIVEEGTSVYVVMEYIEGQSLAEYLDSNPAPEHTFVIHVMQAMASALDYTHAKGIIHRDVKPGNVMIGGGGAVKILDFGIARMSDVRTSTPTGIVMGTVDYMAPEQIKAEAMDGRADQFSMAAVAYRMLTGSTLFGRHTLATLAYKLVNEAPTPVTGHNPAIPGGVDRVLTKALSKSPADRYPTCSAFAGEFASAWTGAMDAPTAAMTSPVTVRTTASKRSATPALILGGALVACAAGGVAIWKPWQQPSRPTPQPVVEKCWITTPEPALPPVTKAVDGIEPKKEPVKTAPPKARPVIKPAEKPPEPPTTVAESLPPVEPTHAEEPHDTPYQRALAALHAEDYPSAIRQFTDVISRRPKLASAHYDRALAYQLMGNFPKAIEGYGDAMRLGHRDAKTYTNRGICEARSHQDDAAFADFNQALTVDPVHPMALNGRGNVYFRRKQYPLAIRDFSAAIRTNPNFVLAYQNRAAARRASGDTFGAADDQAVVQRLKKGK